MEEKYFEWLIESIDPDHVIGSDYQPILNELYFTNFYWVGRFADDENRAFDGYDLRARFAEIVGVKPSQIRPGKVCSCLEMLVALARRIEFEILSNPGYENVPKWFWRFVDNIGIGPVGGNMYGGFSGSYDLGYVRRRIQKWLDREYERDGYGGIFVTTDPKFDFRKLSIWAQMNVVLCEDTDCYQSV